MLQLKYLSYNAFFHNSISNAPLGLKKLSQRSCAKNLQFLSMWMSTEAGSVAIAKSIPKDSHFKIPNIKTDVYNLAQKQVWSEYLDFPLMTIV